jgi:murein lipoprotein
MYLIRRIQVVVALICFPLTTYAQIYECTDSNGKTYHQRFACSSNTTPEQLKTEAPITNSGNKKYYRPDTACLQEVQQESRHCVSTVADPSAATKQCYRERLSPNCMKQIEAGITNNTVQAYAACQQEFQQVLPPCKEKAMLPIKQCLQERLSPECAKQVSLFEQKVEEANKLCVAAFQRLKSCGAELGEKLTQCNKENQAKVGAACAALNEEYGHNSNSKADTDNIQSQIDAIKAEISSIKATIDESLASAQIAESKAANAEATARQTAAIVQELNSKLDMLLRNTKDNPAKK